MTTPDNPEAHLHTVAGYCEQVWNPTPDGAKPSNDGAAPSKWQRITPKNPPQFIPSGKCFLWDAAMNRVITGSNIWDVESCKNHDITHWHPDQPDAPTSGPEAGAPLSDLVHRGPAAQTSFATPQPGPTKDKPFFCPTCGRGPLFSWERVSGGGCIKCSEEPSKQPGPTPETIAERSWREINERVRNLNQGEYGAFTNADWQNVSAIWEEKCRLERERDEARIAAAGWEEAHAHIFTRDKESEAVSRLQEVIDRTYQAISPSGRDLPNGIHDMPSAITALRQDRDGLAALCEEMKGALGDALAPYDKEHSKITEERVEMWRKILALTPAEALARQREKEKAT